MEKKNKLDGGPSVADPDPIAVCDDWFRGTFQSAQQMAAAADGREEHDGAGIDHNACGVSAGAITADSSSPLITNAGTGKKVQTALGARSATTKDGVSIQAIRDRNKK